MLGTGLIGDFYTGALRAHCPDRVRVVYSRTEERGSAFAQRWDIPEHTTDLDGGRLPPGDRYRGGRIPNHLHVEAVEAAVTAGKAVLVTKPLGRNADEARRILETVERAGAFGGYLEDLCYTPKALKAMAAVEEAPSATSPGSDRARRTRAALRVVLGRSPDRWRRDHRPRVPLHRGHPRVRRQGQPAGRGHVPHRHARPSRSTMTTTRSR